MNLKNLPFSWFDLVVLAVLVVGFFRGRKRGMSEELLDVVQWLAAVVVGAIAYEGFGDILFNSMQFLTLLSARIVAYILIVIGVHVVFIVCKRLVGEKLVGSDIFGRLEYYLGMLAGIFRFSCMLLIVMSLVHSRLYTAEQLAASAKAQEKDFGDITLPTWGSIQQEIFNESLSGQFVKKHLSAQLMRPTPHELRAKEEGWGRKREKEVEEITHPKR